MRNLDSADGRVADLLSSAELTIGAAVVECFDAEVPMRRRLAGLVGAASSLRVRRDAFSVGAIDPVESDSPQILTVMDQFSELAFFDEVRARRLVRGQVDLPAGVQALVMEAAWHGSGGAWRRAMNRPWSQVAIDLQDAVARVKKAGIPVIFWAKEDPVGRDVFRDVASWADLVLTTSPESVEVYQNAGVSAAWMPFVLPVRMFNPGLEGRRNSVDAPVVFAGSLRTRKYPDRVPQFRELFAAEHGQPLRIYARPSAGDSGDDWLNLAPDAHVSSASYVEMPAVYRDALCVLNVTSQGRASSLVPRRVFEALACAAPVVSTTSPGVRTLSSPALEVQDASEAGQMIQQLANSEGYRSRIAHRGYRFAHSNHGLDRFFRTVREQLGLSFQHSVSDAKIGGIILADGQPDWSAQWARACLAKQTKQFEEIALVGHRDSVEAVASVARPFVRDVRRVDHLEEALAVARGLGWSHVAFMSDRNFYGPNYLLDRALTIRWADLPAIGAASTNSGNIPTTSFVRSDHVIVASAVVRLEEVEKWRRPLSGCFDGVVNGLHIGAFEWVPGVSRPLTAEELNASCVE